MIRGHSSNSHPQAFFIADSPTSKDIESEYALTGYSESILSEFCKEQHLNLNDFYRTCLIKELYDPTKDTKEQSSGFKR